MMQLKKLWEHPENATIFQPVAVYAIYEKIYISEYNDSTHGHRFHVAPLSPMTLYTPHKWFDSLDSAVEYITSH